MTLQAAIIELLEDHPYPCLWLGKENKQWSILGGNTVFRQITGLAPSSPLPSCEALFEDVVGLDQLVHGSPGRLDHIRFRQKPYEKFSYRIKSAGATDRCIMQCEPLLSWQKLEGIKAQVKNIIDSTQDLMWVVSREFTFITGNESFLASTKRATGRDLREGDSVFSLSCLSSWQPSGKVTTTVLLAASRLVTKKVPAIPIRRTEP
ncbi:MAG: hypothetical protein HC842_04250 [Cytophagales bacterium]|nr:hypothetical protein [Cytophagales bacterium]